MQDQTFSPDEQDIDAFSMPVQNFANGGEATVSNADINNYISQVLNDPSLDPAQRAAAINSAAAQYNVSRDQISQATGYDMGTVNSYLGQAQQPQAQAPAPAPAPAVSNQDVSAYVLDILNNTGLDQAQKAAAINSAATKYGVSREQLSEATGYDLPTVTEYLGPLPEIDPMRKGSWVFNPKTNPLPKGPAQTTPTTTAKSDLLAMNMPSANWATGGGQAGGGVQMAGSSGPINVRTMDYGVGLNQPTGSGPRQTQGPSAFQMQPRAVEQLRAIAPTIGAPSGPQRTEPLQVSSMPRPTMGPDENLAPRVLGGGENVGVMRDRLGNAIMTPGTTQFFAHGGEVSPQHFAFGGIANPAQRAMYRGSDKEYLAARQKEAADYEAQRTAYNNAAQKYEAEVYNPYKSQFDAYAKAVETWNAGPRDTDYAGPAEPTLADFTMTAPTVPFKEEDVVAYQKAAAERARRDAASRGVAIDVVSNPDKFNFGSLSVAHRFMAKGGLAEVNEYNLSDEEDTPINTDPAGSAKEMLSSLVSPKKESPTRQAIKRPARKSGGADAAKEMDMSYESLSSAKDLVPQLKDKGSARSQMEALALAYRMRSQQAADKSRGLMANTLGAPTLEQPTLNKSRLTAKRFEKGGEAKKPEAEVAEPSLFGVSDYATQASARMFPGQLGQDDQRDAARHMLAAGTVARKYGPKAAELLGKAHEYTSNPQTFFSAFGIGQPRDDLPYDVHNNRIGAELAARTKSQAELEKLVEAMARQSQTKQAEGKPWTMSREQMDARKAKAEKGATERPEYRAEGSPEEGEVSQEELDAASKPAFVTPKSGKGRKSSSKPGELEAAALQGVSETPYNLLGAPVDIATMLMRPFGYSTEAPMLGSEDLKRRATKAGIRQEPPKEGTAARALYNLSEVGASAVNPAAPVRAGMKAAKAVGDKAVDVAKDFQQYNRQISVPGASYAVRPTGSTMLTGPVGLEKNVSEVDQLLNKGRSNARSVAGQNVDQEDLITQFWDKKARNYFTRQFGTPDDPVAAAIAKKQIKGTALEEMFPEYMLDQIAAGKTRVNEQGQSRFFPKYPRAMEDFTRRYDQATGIKGNLITANPAAADPGYNLISSEGRAMGRAAAEAEGDKMVGQGLRPELANPNVAITTRSTKEPSRILSDGTNAAKDLLAAFEEASAYRKMTPEQQTEWANTQFGNGRRLQGMNEEEIGQNLLGENVRTAIEKGEPVYDIGYMGKPLSTLFQPDNINQYLASLPPREAANIRFEDAVRGGLKFGENQFKLENIAERIKSGKPVADTVFSQGVSKPLLQFGEDSGLDGFAWKRIEKREATVPEGAYVGHSVGGYELGGATYTADKRDGFNTGKWQVYTLRDNRNRPVNTIEVKMLDDSTPVVTQIKGNGRATGNTAPEKYDGAVLKFLREYLKPAAIQESDSYLTPLLQNYKTELGASPRAQ